VRIINAVFFIVCLSITTLIQAVQSDSDIDLLEEFYTENHLDELEPLLSKAEQFSPNHPTVLYLRGLFEKDAPSALVYFENVYKNHKNSAFADDALFRILQYYYSISDYNKTRAYLSAFFREFTDSSLKEQAQYLYCRTIYAQGKEDSAKIFLRAFIKNVRNSPFVDLAIIDLENPDMWSQARPSELSKDGTVSDSDFRYTIQIGAFTVKKNADRVREKFENDSHYVEIREKDINNRIYYAVWIGRFANRKQAREYAQKNIQKYNIDYKVVKR